MLRKEILISTLESLGASQDLLGDFDLHSTVEIELDSGISIFISDIDGHIWLWSKVDFINSYNIDTNASNLLSLLMEVRPLMLTGQYILGRIDERYEFKALLSDEALSSAENLAYVLESFYSDLMELKSICS
ncbi:MAG: hypothetical protein ACRC9R_02820 [Enterovibrio sp.]